MYITQTVKKTDKARDEQIKPISNRNENKDSTQALKKRNYYK
jgi:hypothetical protein